MASVVEKIRDAVVGNIEVAEAVKEIRSTTGPGATRNVVLSLACWRRRRNGHMRVKP